MSTLDATRAELALLVLYLNKAEARDMICRATQYGSKFLSNGEPGTAQNVDKSTSLAEIDAIVWFFYVYIYTLVIDYVKVVPLAIVLCYRGYDSVICYLSYGLQRCLVILLFVLLVATWWASKNKTSVCVSVTRFHCLYCWNVEYLTTMSLKTFLGI